MSQGLGVMMLLSFTLLVSFPVASSLHSGGDFITRASTSAHGVGGTDTRSYLQLLQTEGNNATAKRGRRRGGQKQGEALRAQIKFALRQSAGLSSSEEPLDHWIKSSGLGSQVNLSQQGYTRVLDLHDEVQTAAFVQRLIDKYNATIADKKDFAGIIPHYSRKSNASPRYADLMRELATAPWLLGFQDASKASLDDVGYNLVADLENDDQMRAYIRRVIVAHGGREAAGHLSIPGKLVFPDGRHLFEMAPRYSGTRSRRSYGALVSELRAAAWIEGFQELSVSRLEHDEDRLRRASTHCDECIEKALLYIGVFSAPDNFRKRDDVRNSWMQDCILHGRKPYVKAQFIIGETDNASLNFDIDEENRVYGDIQRLPIADTTDNLPNKSIAFFRWFARKYCCNPDLPVYWYAMKLHDDSWPNLQMLLPYLRKRKSVPSTMNYVGGFVWKRPVPRRGIMAETANKSKFNREFYPAHAAGSGYILSLNLARKLDENIDEPPGLSLLRNDDTTIGNWVKQENRMRMWVNYYDVNVSRYGCQDETMIAMNLCTGALRCMWEKRLLGLVKGPHKSVNMCCKSPELSGVPGFDC